MQNPAPGPSPAQHPSRLLRFIIGQDEAGRWLAMEAGGRMGGLFKTEADAVHFARFESGQHAGEIEVAPRRLRLEF